MNIDKVHGLWWVPDGQKRFIQEINKWMLLKEFMTHYHYKNSDKINFFYL